MEPAASQTPRLSTTASLQVPDESVMASLQERLGVKRLQSPPPSSAQRTLAPFTPESLHGSLLREFIEQWIQNGCIPVAFEARKAEIRIDPVVRVATERELVAAGYLLSSSESEPGATKVEPSTTAISWMWSSTRTRSSLSALAKLAQPSVDGSVLYKDAQAALLAVVHRFQSSTVLGLEALAHLLQWSKEGTTTWLKKALADQYIRPNEGRTGVVITPLGEERLKALKVLGGEGASTRVARRGPIDHEEVKSRIPHVVAGLMQALRLFQGVSAREIGSALGLTEHFLRSSGILDDLVACRVLKKTLHGIDRFDPELRRLKATTMLYQVSDPKFAPDLTRAPLDETIKLITNSMEASSPSGKRLADPSTGFSIQKMKELIAEFRGDWFTQAELRSKLASRSQLPSDLMDLQRTLHFLVRASFLEQRDTRTSEFGRRKLAYRVNEASST